MRFWSGVAAGAALVTTIAHAVIAWVVLPIVRPSLVGMYDPSVVVTALAMHPLWSWGIPCAIFLAVIVIAGIARDEALRVGALFTLAGLAIAAIVVTIWIVHEPFFDLRRSTQERAPIGTASPPSEPPPAQAP